MSIAGCAGGRAHVMTCAHVVNQAEFKGLEFFGLNSGGLGKVLGCSRESSSFPASG